MPPIARISALPPKYNSSGVLSMSEKFNTVKTVIYLRKSRKDRDNETIEATLRRHEEQLLSYAEKQNLNVVEIKKEVVTGDSIAVRPQMQSLLEEVEDGRYDAVLVMDIDRLGRGDMIDQGIIASTFKKAAAKILTPDKEYDLDNEYDEEFFDLSAFFARKELKMIKRRLQRGKIKSIQEGNYIGAHAPFGYDKYAKTLIINEKERPVLELIFDLYVNQGMGDTKISKYLESLCIPNKSGGMSWDRTTIRRIIRNPVYIGKIVWNKRECQDTAAGKRKRLLPSAQQKLYSGKHPPIIEEKLFYEAQQISKIRHIPHLRENLSMRNPLSYLVKCGACGHTMTMRSSKSKPDSLRCYRHCGGTSSSYLSIVEERLIEQLYDALSEMQLEFAYQKQSVALEEEYHLLKDSLNHMKAEIKKLDKQKNRQFELLEQGVYDSGTFLIRSQVILEKILKANDMKKEIKEKLALCSQEIQKLDLSIPRILDARYLIENYYWKLTPALKNDFLRSILSEVTYYKKKGADQQDFTLELMLKL